MQLSSEQLEAAEDPMSSVARRSTFWAALARGDRHAASEAAHGISVPHVLEEAFSFNSAVSDSGQEGTLVLSVDTGAENVALETPKAVVDGWNADRDVSFVDLDVNGLCMAATDKGNVLDFRACMNCKNGLPLDSSFAAVICTMTTHRDQPNKNPKLRLQSSDPIGVFAIMAPRSKVSVAPKCFSQPLFELSKFPASLLALERHLVLLEIKAKSRVLKFILEGYPGEDEMWWRTSARSNTPPRLRAPLPYLSMAKLRLSTARASAAAESPESRRLIAQSREEVTQAPGIDSMLRQQQRLADQYQSDDVSDAGGDYLPPTNTFGWESAADNDTISMAGSLNTHSSLGELSSLASGAVLAKVLNKCNELSKVIANLKLENKAKDASLSSTIRKMRIKTRRLEEDLKEQTEAGLGTGVGGLFDELRPNPPPGLTPSDRQSVARVVISQIAIGRYALKSKLPPILLVLST